MGAAASSFRSPVVVGSQYFQRVEPSCNGREFIVSLLALGRGLSFQDGRGARVCIRRRRACEECVSERARERQSNTLPTRVPPCPPSLSVCRESVRALANAPWRTARAHSPPLAPRVRLVVFSRCRSSSVIFTPNIGSYQDGRRRATAPLVLRLRIVMVSSLTSHVLTACPYGCGHDEVMMRSSQPYGLPMDRWLYS